MILTDGVGAGVGLGNGEPGLGEGEMGPVWTRESRKTCIFLI